jgi:hypothetical protein
VRRIAVLVVALALIRGALGAVLDAPGIGPDERGHLMYLQTFATNGWSGVQGVEARQTPVGYLPTLAAWWLAGGPADPTAMAFAPTTVATPTLAARLVSVAWSGVTAWAVWVLASLLWPTRPWTALLATLLATLAPGYVYVMASVTNEAAATTLATLTILTGAQTTAAPASDRTRRIAIWAIVALIAVATKVTNVPVVAATALAIAWSLRTTWRPWLGYRPVRIGMTITAVVVVGAYGALLTRHPTSSYAATAARIWPEAIVVGTVAIVQDGAAAEAIRTFWHGWDYDVAWPQRLDDALTVPLAGTIVVAVVGAIAATNPTHGASTRHAILWIPVAAQVAFAVVRYGIGSIVGAEMGGAAQAKTFFPAIAPAAMLGAAGLVTIATVVWHTMARPNLTTSAISTEDGQRAGASPPSQSTGHEDPSLVRAVTLATIACLVATDLVGLALSAWRHAQWVVPVTA